MQPKKITAKAKQQQNQKAAKKVKTQGGPKDKKKWTGTRTKERSGNSVVIDKELYDKLVKEISNSKVITISIISDRLKVNCSVAKRAIRDLNEKGLIKPVLNHSKLLLYTSAKEADKGHNAASASVTVTKK